MGTSILGVLYFFLLIPMALIGHGIGAGIWFAGWLLFAWSMDTEAQSDKWGDAMEIAGSILAVLALIAFIYRLAS